MKVDDAHLDALAMTRHRFHGDWNYTLHPHPDHAADTTAATSTPRSEQAPRWDAQQRARLADPELTGMPRLQLDTLTRRLAPLQVTQRQQQRRQRRSGERRRAPGAGARPTFTDPDRILTTILSQRGCFTHALLGELFGTSETTITRAIQATRPLLEERGCRIAPSTARFTTPADVIAYLDVYGSNPPIQGKPSC